MKYQGKKDKDCIGSNCEQIAGEIGKEKESKNGCLMEVCMCCTRIFIFCIFLLVTSNESFMGIQIGPQYPTIALNGKIATL